MRLGASSDDSRQIGAHRRNREDGTAVVEFALIVPLLLLIVFGILDFGRALNYLNDSTQLARAGARWAVVDKPFSDLDKWDDTHARHRSNSASRTTASPERCVTQQGCASISWATRIPRSATR